MNPRLLVIFTVAVLCAAAWQRLTPPAEATPTAGNYSTQKMVSTSYLGAAANNVIEFAPIPGRPNEALVAQQTGYVYRVALDGSFPPSLWGDVHTEVTFDNGEQGLLAVAFSPDFLTSGRVYIYYTPGSPTPTVLSRFTATATDLNEASEEQLLNIEEFAGNHNGGHIVFDSAGHLYLSLGDGGGANDPNEKGQSLTTLLGKVLRLDVSGATGYTIPAVHLFDDGVGPIREEIFAYGFRNPWRMTIDAATDDLWVGDVGQASWEEVDRVVIGGNYGWDCYEGNHPFELTGCPAMGTMQFPRAEYDHSLGSAVTGGAVYRGADMPELAGWYVYADFYTGTIWAVNPADASAPIQLVDTSLNIASFTPMADGELAIVSYGSGIYRLAPLDQDGDLDVAVNDNCPAWPNPAQNLPSWPVINDDSDCDGFARNREVYIGTAHAQHCAATVTPNDEPTPDAWPADFNDDRTANGQDTGKFGGPFGSFNKLVSQGPFGPPGDELPGERFDFNGNGIINGQDTGKYQAYFNKTCA